MRNPRLIVDAGLAGEDLKSAIDLIGIRTNNFAVEPVCQLDGENAFADPGGAGDNDWRIIVQADGRDRCAFRPMPWLRSPRACGPYTPCREARRRRALPHPRIAFAQRQIPWTSG